MRSEIRDGLRLMRPANMLMVAIVLWTMQYWVAVPVAGEWSEGLMSWWMMLLLTVSIVCIAAGGYVVNDYFDVKIDRINRPERLIVTNTLSKTTTMWLFRILTGIGVACGIALSWAIHSMTLLLVIVMVPGLLWFYSASYKRQFLVGNIIVSIAAGLVPLCVALANVGLLKHRFGDILQYTTLVHDLYAWLGGFSLFAMLTTLIREVVKDMQDEQGDRELECHSMPIVLGMTGSKVVVSVLIALVGGLLWWFNCGLIPYAHEWGSLSTRFVLYGISIPLAGELWLLWAAKIPSDYKTAQLLMKWVIFMGVMYSFVVMRMV